MSICIQIVFHDFHQEVTITLHSIGGALLYLPLIITPAAKFKMNYAGYGFQLMAGNINKHCNGNSFPLLKRICRTNLATMVSSITAYLLASSKFTITHSKVCETG